MGDFIDLKNIDGKIKKTDTNAVTLHFSGIKSGWFQYFLLRADAHHDNPATDQAFEKRLLKEALEKRAGIIDIGDLFCAMQGKYDKRSDKSKVRPEHQTARYLDALVETAADFYQPFANNFISLGYGNHETSILEKHETDLTQRLASVLNDRTGASIQALGYTGWIHFKFTHNGTRREKKVLWYTHGYGGGGPVTEDMIQSSRQRVFIENADIMISGHVHRSWIQEFVKQRLTQNGRVVRREGYYIKIPSMKDAYGKGVRGFETQRGHGPRPVGAYWLKFYYRDEMIKMRVYKAD